MRGKVKWFNKTKGYGFIVPNNGGKDVFVHITDIQKSGLTRELQEGDAISYELQSGRGGKENAINLQLG